MILYMSVVSVATSPFSFLILLLWVLSLFFSISLGKSLSGPPRWHTGKDSSCQCKRHKTLSWIPGLGRSSGVENGNPCSILAWKAPWTKEPGGPQSIGLQRVGHHWAHTHTHTHTHKGLSILSLSKNQVLISLIFLVSIYFCSDLYNSFPSIDFGSCLLFL